MIRDIRDSRIDGVCRRDTDIAVEAVDVLQTCITERVAIRIFIGQALQRLRLPVLRHQRALTGYYGCAEAEKKRIAVRSQVNDVLMIRKLPGKGSCVGKELVGPYCTRWTMSDDFAGFASGDRMRS